MYKFNPIFIYPEFDEPTLDVVETIWRCEAEVIIKKS